MKQKLALLLLPLAFFVLTAELVEDWWSNRDNNLHNNGRWIIGKDSGKFLFYTYQFMFETLENNKVQLNAFMGHQEILYREAETDQKRLKKLNFEMVSGSRAYLWVLLRKEGQRSFACRFSYRDHFPSGFFTFDEDGALLKHRPFDHPMPAAGKNREQAVAITLSEGLWTASLDGQVMGTATDPSFKNGYFGFRGSGFLRQVNSIDSVRIEWVENGKTIIEKEDFKAPNTTPYHWLFIFAFSLLLVVLRQLRTRILSQHLPTQQGTKYLLIDSASAPLLLGGVTQLLSLSNLTELGLSLLLLEIVSFTVFARLAHRQSLHPKIKLRGMLLFGLACILLATLSLYRHGEWAGRRQYNPAQASKESFPSAFIPTPKPEASANTLTKEDFSLRYGEPFSSNEVAFNELDMVIEFTMPSNTTFDIAFQQQSFFTKGDPQGERLPLQRRLIRLSTRPHVSSGVAMGTGRQPDPFAPLKGSLNIGVKNRITIQSTQQGLAISLNEIVTPLLPQLQPLGYGEILLMTYEQPILIEKLKVQTTQHVASQRHLLPLFGFLTFPLIVLVGWILFKALGGSSFALATTGAVAVTFPMAIYAAAILFIDPTRLSLLSTARLTLLDWALASSAFALLYWIPLHRRECKIPAVPANLFLLLFIASLGLIVWDHFLAPEHPLKTQFTTRHSKPGELASTDHHSAPWYTHNQRIGSNLFVWRQQWEGRWIPIEKQPGTLRVYVLGGSQAWGSGAASSEQTFSRLLQQRGQQADLPIEVLNAGVNGAGISSVRDVFFQILPPFQPDIVILDLGLNDSAGLHGKTKIKKHVSVLRKIAQACADRNIELILVHEPISPESMIRLHDPLYAAYAEVATAFGFQIVDPRPRFKESNSMEMVWWDAAHFTPRGHHLMAEQIFPALKNAVEKRIAE